MYHDFVAYRKRSCLGSNTRKSVYLWEFLFGLLEDDECATVIRWISKGEGIFELKNTEELAKLWGTLKNRPNMNKEKLIRAMRTYYERGMLKKVASLIFFTYSYTTYQKICSYLVTCILFLLVYNQPKVMYIGACLRINLTVTKISVCQFAKKSPDLLLFCSLYIWFN